MEGSPGINMKNRGEGEREEEERAMHSRTGMGSLEVSGVIFSELRCL